MILLDVTMSYTFRRANPMGLLRVEQEVIRAFREALGDAVTFGIYNHALKQYFRVDPKEIDAMLDLRAWRVPLLDRALTSPSRLRRHARRLRLMGELRRSVRLYPGSDAASVWRRDEIIAQALSRVSLEEYSSLRSWIQPLATRFANRFGPWVQRADQRQSPAAPRGTGCTLAKPPFPVQCHRSGSGELLYLGRWLLVRRPLRICLAWAARPRLDRTLPDLRPDPGALAAHDRNRTPRRLSRWRCTGCSGGSTKSGPSPTPHGRIYWLMWPITAIRR